MDKLCDCCGIRIDNPKDAYPATHINGESLMLCLECWNVANDAKKLAK